MKFSLFYLLFCLDEFVPNCYYWLNNQTYHTEKISSRNVPKITFPGKIADEISNQLDQFKST